MTISIAVLVHEEGEQIRDTLNSIVKQRSKNYIAELLIIANAASPETLKECQEWIGENCSINTRLLLNSDNNLARARNLAIDACTSEFIAFLDGDCIAPMTWVGTIYTAYCVYSEKYPHLCGIGGGAKTIARTNFAKSLVQMQENFLGHLNSPQARPIPYGLPVDHIPTMNVLYSVKALRIVEGFDLNFSFVCEDVELGYRLRKHSYQLMLVPGCLVEHYARDNIGSWAARMWRFGFGQILVMHKHKGHIRLRTLMPLLFLPLMMISLFSGILFSVLFFLIPAFYLFLLCAVSVRIAKLENESSGGLKICFAFLLTHSCYSWGEWQGVTRQLIALKHV